MTGYCTDPLSSRTQTYFYIGITALALLKIILYSLGIVTKLCQGNIRPENEVVQQKRIHKPTMTTVVQPRLSTFIITTNIQAFTQTKFESMTGVTSTSIGTDVLSETRDGSSLLFSKRNHHHFTKDYIHGSDVDIPDGYTRNNHLQVGDYATASDKNSIVGNNNINNNNNNSINIISSDKQYQLLKIQTKKQENDSNDTLSRDDDDENDDDRLLDASLAGASRQNTLATPIAMTATTSIDSQPPDFALNVAKTVPVRPQKSQKTPSVLKLVWSTLTTPIMGAKSKSSPIIYETLNLENDSRSSQKKILKFKSDVDHDYQRNDSSDVELTRTTTWDMDGNKSYYDYYLEKTGGKKNKNKNKNKNKQNNNNDTNNNNNLTIDGKQQKQKQQQRPAIRNSRVGKLVDAGDGYYNMNYYNDNINYTGAHGGLGNENNNNSGFNYITWCDCKCTCSKIDCSKQKIREFKKQSVLKMLIFMNVSYQEYNTLNHCEQFLLALQFGFLLLCYFVWFLLKLSYYILTVSYWVIVIVLNLIISSLIFLVRTSPVIGIDEFDFCSNSSYACNFSQYYCGLVRWVILPGLEETQLPKYFTFSLAGMCILGVIFFCCLYVCELFEMFEMFEMILTM